MSRNIEEEAAEALAADLKVAGLILHHHLDAFRELAEDVSRQQSLAILAFHDIQPKLERELCRMQEAEAFDELRFFSRAEAPKEPLAEQILALESESALAGFELHEGALGFMAEAPFCNRERGLIGGLLLRRGLKESGLLDAIDRETRASASLAHWRNTGWNNNFNRCQKSCTGISASQASL